MKDKVEKENLVKFRSVLVRHEMHTIDKPSKSHVYFNRLTRSKYV